MRPAEAPVLDPRAGDGTSERHAGASLLGVGVALALLLEAAQTASIARVSSATVGVGVCPSGTAHTTRVADLRGSRAGGGPFGGCMPHPGRLRTGMVAAAGGAPGGVWHGMLCGSAVGWHPSAGRPSHVC